MGKNQLTADSADQLRTGKAQCPSYLYSVGAHITQPSDWAAVPVQLLRDAFELQSNALDNCAAACVCKSWQTAVNNSCVPVLHLHIHDKETLPSCLAQWRSYLAARSSIGNLKLTAGGSAVTFGNGYHNYLKVGNHLNPLACVPADCNSLTVDEHFAPFVGDYTDQPVKLQHLAIKYSERPTDRWTPGRDPLATVRNLSHLTQLTSLKVKAPANGLAGLRVFPRSLTSLYIGSCGEQDLRIHLPDPAADSGQEQESECLRRLSSLEFRRCCVHIWAGSITLLQGLTSLSLCHSDVSRDLDAVTMLTNLESLDLTRVGIPRKLFPHERQPWSRFEAWPALRVFKFVGCWLIDNSTVLDIATVQEVHTGRLASGMETANIHLVLWHTCRHAIMLESLASLLSPAWSIHIVDLHVVVHDDTALHFATIVNQVLEGLLCLQSFQLVGPLCGQGPADNIDREQGRIVLGDGYSGQLKNLQLQYMHCSTLDLEVANLLDTHKPQHHRQAGCVLRAYPAK